MGDHAKLSPSSASRWLYCQKSIEECEGLENGSSPYAEEGTLAHALLEQWLVVGFEPEWPEEYPDMKEAVKIAYEYVTALSEESNAVFATEIQVKPDQLGTDGVWGTADVLIYHPETYELFVIDYKHGKGVPVDVEGNSQLQIYALGAIAHAGRMGWHVETVRTVIIQPRIFGREPVLEHLYFIEELAEIAEAMAVQIAKIGTDEAEYCPSEYTCRWCLAKHKCPAMADTVNAVVPFEALDVVPEAKEDALILYHEKKGLIKKWMEAMDAQLIAAVEEGRMAGRLKLVRGRQGNRRWAEDEETTVKKLRSELKMRVSDCYVKKLASPTAIEKVLLSKPKRGQDKKMEALESLIERSPGKVTVADINDKREAIAPVEKFEAIEKN